MRRTRKEMLVIFLYALAMGLFSCGGTDEPSVKLPPDDKEKETFNYLFKDGMGGYEVHRIPAIVKTGEGTLLAFAEARKKRSNGDSGDIDLVVRRSEDGGETWSNLIMIWDDAANTCGNPVPIVDEETGRIHLLATWNHGEDKWGDLTKGTGKDTRRPFYIFSDDDGKSWSAPEEITGAVKKPHWDWYGTGPVHGIQIQNGSHKGRLVAPCYFTVRQGDTRKDYSHVIYSDDNGATWIPGDSTAVGPVGECTVAELSEGRLMLNMRTSASFTRKISVSNDGGHTWSQPETDYNLVDPKCQGSLLSVLDGNQPVLFFANAASAERNNMTIKMSIDEGETWTKSYAVHSGPSAYSDIVMIDEEHIAILFEGGINRPYEGLSFEIVPLSDFK